MSVEKEKEVPLRLQRIQCVDAVRGTALLMILLVHCWFSYSGVVDRSLDVSWLDSVAHFISFHVCKDRGFFIFSFLFGLSFFLQMDHAAYRGIDFRGRFCWRLTLLFLMGMVDRIFFKGDILIHFSLAGLLMVVMWKLKTRWFVLLVCICLCQPVILYQSLVGNTSPGDVEASMLHTVNSCQQYLGWTWREADPSSFLSMAKTNYLSGFVYTFVLYLYNGRFWTMLAMFFMGVIAGRTAFFQRGIKPIGIALAIAAVVLVVLKAWLILSPSLLLDKMVYAAMAACMICGLALIYSLPRVKGHLTYLTSVGRTTLTCYLSQNILLSWLFFPWGLGVGLHASTFERFCIGVGFYVVQMLLATWYLKTHRFGPVEWVWRKLTKMGLEKKETPGGPASAA